MRKFKAALLLAGALGTLAGCGEEQKKQPVAQAKEIILNVRTVDKSNKPVEMVRFYINNKKFGITDQDGSFKGRYGAKDGDLLTFNVEAPSGYSVPADVDQSQWKYEVRYPADGRAVQVDFTATLQRPEQQYLFMVRTKTPATPVQVNGKTAGKTGPSGDGLIFVKGVPGSNFAARAGSVTFKSRFAEDEAVYLITPEKQTRIGGAEEPPPADPPAAPPSVAAATTATEPAAPVSVAMAPDTQSPATAAPAPVVTDAPAAAPATENLFAGVQGGNNQRAPETDAPRRRPVRAPQPVAEPEPAPQPAPQPTPRRAPDPPPQPEPQPTPQPTVVVANPEPPPAKNGGDDDLMGILDDPEPEKAQVVVAPEPAAPPPEPEAMPATDPPPKRKRSERIAAESKLGEGLMDDGEKTVSSKAVDGKATITKGGAGASPAAMSREQVDGELNRIKRSLAGSKVLARADVDFLGQVERSQGGNYYEANRLLADYYYRINDYKRQAASLEVATKRGRYKHDPSILLSLAKAYGKVRNYGKALRAMTRVERKMRRLPAAKKADAYRFHAELLEFEFLRQMDKDQKGANTLLLDKAISKWERYQTFSRGADAGGVAKAGRKIKELKELKKKVEL